MTKHVILIGLLLITCQLQSQFHIGLKTGVMINRTSLLESIDPIADQNTFSTSYQVGVVGQYDLTKAWSIHSGINYSDRRSDLGIGTDVNIFGLNVPVGINNRLSVKSIDIPLALSYNYDLGRHIIYPQVGILSSFVLSGTLTPQVRSIVDFNLGHIEGAHSLPLKTFDKSYQESKGVLDSAKSSGKVIVIYCQSEKCKDSFVMASKLHNRGYNVRVFKGGWELWKMSGLN